MNPKHLLQSGYFYAIQNFRLGFPNKTHLKTCVEEVLYLHIFILVLEISDTD